MFEQVIGYVREIRCYPVKSMQGVTLHPDGASLVSWSGLHGDRVWVVVDQQGVVITAKQRAGQPLLRCRTEIHEGECWVRLPDDRCYPAGSLAASQALSALLGFAVRFVRTTDPAESARFTNAGFPLRPGVGYDSSPLHVQTMASIQALARLRGVPRAQVTARFRPNLVIQTDPAAEGFIEQEWIKDQETTVIKLGPETEIVVRKATIRCALPTRPQLGIAEDPEFLRILHKQCGNVFGIYAFVQRPGAVRLKDRVRLTTD